MRIVTANGRLWSSDVRLSRRPLAAGAALLGLFALLALLVGQRRLVPVDLAVLERVQSVSGPGLDALAGVLNYVAAAEVVLAGACLAAAWLLRRGVPLPAAGAPLAFLGALPIELALKYTLDQPVPSEFYRPTLPYGFLTLKTMESFPSGHVLRAAFVAVLGGYVAWRSWPGARAALLTVALGGLVALCAWCRVYQGQHWPMDVLGGALLGAAAGCTAIALLAPALENEKAPSP